MNGGDISEENQRVFSKLQWYSWIDGKWGTCICKQCNNQILLLYFSSTQNAGRINSRGKLGWRDWPVNLQII